MSSFHPALHNATSRTRTSTSSAKSSRRSATAAVLPRVLSAVALSSALVSSPGEARPPVDNDGGGGKEPKLGCKESITGSLTFSPGSIGLGQTALLHYHANVPSNCTNVKLYLDGERLTDKAGSRTVAPNANTTYRLSASYANVTLQLASATLKVDLPQRVTITGNDQVALLVQALGTPGTDVVIQDHVDIDLSNRVGIRVAERVRLLGGRNPRVPGARLRTTTRPLPLLEVVGDKVRISGIRIEGPDMGVSDSEDKAAAIRIDDKSGIEIDHNEISGFSDSGVKVGHLGGLIAPWQDPVRVHDNFIHHNQSLGRLGYGVKVGHGSYATIEQNVFDWNRHAIAGDGSDDSGYRAYRNLVLEHGGLHRWILGVWTHTHQFDMHGQDNCDIGALFSDSLYNCGTAGHDMDIRYNSFLYKDDNAIKLRGTPQVGAYVKYNVFAHDSVGDALHQNESGMHESDNLADINGMKELGRCDFDGDGRQDSFLATGQTWWYASGGTGPWTFLNQSRKRKADVELGFFDGDAKCDVRTGGVVYSGGKPATLPPICMFPSDECAAGCCVPPSTPPRPLTCRQSCLAGCRAGGDMLPRQCMEECSTACED